MVAEHRAWASINLSSLKANLSVARSAAPHSSVVAVIKADAYGHGMIPAAHALSPELKQDDCFGVATIEEALTLRRAGIGKSILLLEGCLSEQELALALEHQLHCVIHSLYQLEMLVQYFQANPDTAPLKVWLKADTGMHRLGLNKVEFAQCWNELKDRQYVTELVFMTHLACADDVASAMTDGQVALLKTFIADLDAPSQSVRLSIAASGGILNWPDTHFDFVRPGIMLYGGSSKIGEYGQSKGLRPVMTLKARLIAIKSVAAGESVGYGATYTCQRDSCVGIVSIGYGDGYPRHAPSGTPVLLKTASGSTRVSTVGRVSMDMIAIDLSDCEGARIGDEVTLWGEGLPADEIAALCGTISYELFCQVTARVHFIYS